MTLSHRISIGMNLSQEIWKPSQRLRFEEDCLTSEDSIRYANATAIILTDDAPRILSTLCDLGAVPGDLSGSVRWINVGPNE